MLLIAGVPARLAADGVPVGLTVVEVDVVALCLDGAAAALIGGEIVRRAALLRPGGHGDVLARRNTVFMAGRHADPGFRCQRIRDGDGRAERQIDIIFCAAGTVGTVGVVDDLRRTGHLEGGGRPYAAAILGCVCGDAAAVHGEGRTAVHIHAAVCGAVAGDRGIAAHVACAGHIHTAASGGVAGGLVAGDPGIAVHGKCAVRSRIHAGAAAGHGVIADRAAGQLENSLIRINAAAIGCAVLLDLRRVGDGQLVAGRSTVIVHPAAVAFCGSIAGDDGIVGQREVIIINVYAAAVTVRHIVADGTAFYCNTTDCKNAAAVCACRVVADHAVVHGKAAAGHIHAATSGGGVVTGDLAAVHGECTAIHTHTAATL